MPRIAPILLASALLASGCEMLTPGGRTIKACRENLISNLKDRESYRQDSDPKVIQEEPGQPKVWGWYYNAKNSMGGYGDGSEVLCYQEESGRVVQQSFGVDDAEKRQLFLAVTSPKIQKEIDDKAAAKAKAKADQRAADAKAKAQREANAATNAARERRIYNRNYDELVAFCRAKSTPDPTLGEYGYVDLDFSPYRLRVTERMDIKNLEYGCKTLNKNHTDEWGKVTPAPKAFNTGLLKIHSTYVNQWGKYRSVICAKDPQFCR